MSLQALGQTRLRLAAQFAAYGPRWTVTDADGTPRGSVTLYIRQITDRVPDLSGGGIVVDTRWQGTGPLSAYAKTPTANGIRAGRRLTSPKGVRFYVQSEPDLTRGIVEVAVDPLPEEDA